MNHQTNDTHPDKPEARNEKDSLPHARCLRDIMDDESYLKYSDYSEINICHTASLGKSASPDIPYEYAAPQPPPEPPPNTPVIRITEV